MSVLLGKAVKYLILFPNMLLRENLHGVDLFGFLVTDLVDSSEATFPYGGQEVKIACVGPKIIIQLGETSLKLRLSLTGSQIHSVIIIFRDFNVEKPADVLTRRFTCLVSFPTHFHLLSNVTINEMLANCQNPLPAFLIELAVRLKELLLGWSGNGHWDQLFHLKL